MRHSHHDRLLQETRRGVLFCHGRLFYLGLVPVVLEAAGANPGLADFVSPDCLVGGVCRWHVLLWQRHWAWLAVSVRQPRLLGLFVASSLLLSVNWLIYIWAVNENHVVEASLGYFINPLVNVLLGRVFLGERLSPPQALAVLLAALGVAWLTLSLGALPWVALSLAASFGVYGLLRKQAPLPSLEGLALETFLLAPLAALALAWFHWQGQGAFGQHGLTVDALLMGAGVVTAVPLLLFASGARRLKLATVGLIQYIGPTMQLLLGVWLYHEPFGAARAVGFGLIWTALALYSGHGLLSYWREPWQHN
ncbi:MAG: EamA family transporter RarD [Rivihabitans pingtungensis]